LGTYFLHDVPRDVPRTGPEQSYEEAENVFGEPCRFERWTGALNMTATPARQRGLGIPNLLAARAENLARATASSAAQCRSNRAAQPLLCANPLHGLLGRFAVSNHEPASAASLFAVMISIDHR
jgi:hypothetical protein